MSIVQPHHDRHAANLQPIRHEGNSESGGEAPHGLGRRARRRDEIEVKRLVLETRANHNVRPKSAAVCYESRTDIDAKRAIKISVSAQRGAAAEIDFGLFV